MIGTVARMAAAGVAETYQYALSDSFNRANGVPGSTDNYNAATLLSTYGAVSQSARAWTGDVASYAILTNQLRQTTWAWTYLYLPVPWSGAFTITCKLNALPGSANWGFFAASAVTPGADNITTGYKMGVGADGSYGFSRTVAGVATVIGGGPAGTITAGAVFVWKRDQTGRHTITVNGTTRVNVVDTTTSTGTMVGFHQGEGDSLVDDFSVVWNGAPAIYSLSDNFDRADGAVGSTNEYKAAVLGTTYGAISQGPKAYTGTPANYAIASNQLSSPLGSTIFLPTPAAQNTRLGWRQNTTGGTSRYILGFFATTAAADGVRIDAGVNDFTLSKIVGGAVTTLAFDVTPLTGDVMEWSWENGVHNIKKNGAPFVTNIPLANFTTNHVQIHQVQVDSRLDDVWVVWKV